MNFQSIIDLAIDNILYTVVIGVIVIFILFRLFRTARMYLGAKSFVRKSRRLDRKKYSGLVLVDKIKRKRKKDSNSFKKLRGSAKKKVRKYLGYKFDELPVFTRYSYGKLLKRSNDKLRIIIKNERKTLKRISMKKGQKQLIDIINKYNCLDEVIIFLHNLPEAIIEQQEYDVIVGEDEEIIITYQVK